MPWHALATCTCHDTTGYMYVGTITHVSSIPSHLQKLEVTERLEALVNHSFKRLSTVALQYPPTPSPASLGRTPWIRKP